MKNTITLKSTHKVGKGLLTTPFYTADIEIKKKHGVCQIFIDGTYGGLNRVEPLDAWELVASYLGAYLIEDVTFGTKAKRQPKPNSKTKYIFKRK